MERNRSGANGPSFERGGAFEPRRTEPPAERPKLNLAKRSTPLESSAAVSRPQEGPTKSNPFGGAAPRKVDPDLEAKLEAKLARQEEDNKARSEPADEQSSVPRVRYDPFTGKPMEKK